MSIKENEWPNCVRVVHLLGGLRAMNNPGKLVKIGPGITGISDFEIEITVYRNLGTDCKALGFVPIGVEYYSTKDQVEGNYPPDWRIDSSLDYSVNPGRKGSVQTGWSNIAMNREHEDNFLKGLARRISFALMSCKFRIWQVSEGYTNELIAASKRDVWLEDQDIFGTLNTDRTLLALSAFFLDVCILRDRFAEFISNYVFPSKTQNISTFSSLRSKILKPISAKDEFAKELMEISDQRESIGWLGSIGLYRDYLTHVGPLSNMGRTAMMRYTTMSISSGKTFPYLELPLPTFNSIKEMDFNISTEIDILKIQKEDDEIRKGLRIDALGYALDTLRLLYGLSEKLICFSPIRPEAVVLTKEDLRRPI